MLMMWILTFLLVAYVPMVHLFLTPVEENQENGDENLENEIVKSCELECKNLKDSESNYAVESSDDPYKPGAPMMFAEDILKRVAEKRHRQCPFECIYNKTDEETRKRIEGNKEYQALVKKCKSAEEDVKCDPSYPYRTIDGSCNNLLKPKSGRTLSRFERLYPSNYEGVAGFRKSVCGGDLPEPRTLSLTTLQHINERPTKWTHLLPLFGQFISHDLTDTAITQIGDKTMECCPSADKPQYPDCKPIHIGKDDPFYSKRNVTCLNFQRAAANDDCSLEKRYQINTVTSYLDGSVIYGSTESKAAELRAFDGTGKLKTQQSRDGKPILPKNEKQPAICGNKEKGEMCFDAGDRRVNMHSILMAIQTLFLNEHNRIADALKILNPKWDGEKLYQETRKIICALIEVVTYNELLPALIGQELMLKYNLQVKGEGHNVYDETQELTIWIEFSACAYRLHGLINNIATGLVPKPPVIIQYTFQNVSNVYEGMESEILEGTCSSPALDLQQHIASDMADYLLRKPEASWGSDIASTNIQRGRDVGLPTYVEILSYQTGTPIITFEQLEPYMSPERIEHLKAIYCDVKDIDFWVGIQNEKFDIEKAAVGPTASEIIANQFWLEQTANRHHMQHEGNFHPDQLQALIDVKLSSILCANTRIKSIQKNALLLTTESNPVVECSSLPPLNLDPWKEKESLDTNI